ncbi:hypothetical protein AT575_06575 [Streptococcus penaeicida]|uniref:Peptidase C39-like domain-containing protein n=1 Tax=Streptococcus penaeicida TaxID=1765960 RepID=A0A2N8LBL6_9STRE|nr:GBS Bsp-like repeat-containing protein [Streptococcus penaeicida]PND47545.1 hypothetical protein AT575_06575 [Streptococcus penaeicida]
MKKVLRKSKKTWVILGVSSLGLLSGLQTYSVSAEEQVATNPVPINQAQIESPQTVETFIVKVNQIPSKGTIESPQNPVTASVDNQSVSTPEVSSTTNNPSNSEVSPSEKTVKNLASTEATVTKPTVNYTSHVSNIGWQNPVQESQISGTTGQSKAVEAITITIDNPSDGNITYASHVANIGWQNPVSEGQISGTTGQSKAMEAIRIQLTGDLALQYDIYYRTHIADYGWLSWAKNGESAGSQGLGKRMEAYEVQLIQKGQTVTLDTSKAFILFTKPTLTYQSNIINSGWQNKVSEGVLSGTTGQSKQIQAFLLSLNNKAYGDITYRVHVSNIGWQNFVSSEQMAGVLTNLNRIEAIEMKLSGYLDSRFDLKYRAHVQNIGWQSWVYDRYVAGTTGQSKAIEALEIQLVEKSRASQGIIQNERPQQGLADVVILAGTSGKQISKIKVAAWSTADQSNLAWYESSAATSGATTIRINQQRHKSLIGKYIVHAYVYYQDGSVQKIEVGTTNLRAALITPYYNQRDSRWGWKQYGISNLAAAGCVPTSLAMIFSSLSGKTILPPQVADFLYTKTNEFNKSFIGTSAQGLISAVTNFGYQYSNLTTASAITSALQAGHHVACAIQYNKFVASGSHEMVLKGYSNGYTYVYDPYTSGNCGWYPIQNLWNERSTDKDDNRGVAAPFFKITTL